MHPGGLGGGIRGASWGIQGHIQEDIRGPLAGHPVGFRWAIPEAIWGVFRVVSGGASGPDNLGVRTREDSAETLYISSLH